MNNCTANGAAVIAKWAQWTNRAQHFVPDFTCCCRRKTETDTYGDCGDAIILMECTWRFSLDPFDGCVHLVTRQSSVRPAKDLMNGSGPFFVRALFRYMSGDTWNTSYDFVLVSEMSPLDKRHFNGIQISSYLTAFDRSCARW